MNDMFVRLSIKEQVHFAKRLAFLISAGVPVVDSLTLLKNQAKSNKQKNLYSEIITSVSSGHYLAHSLAKFEHQFGTFTINLIKIGETSGTLSQNLIYLADELHKKQELRKKIIGALIYPIFITVATLLLSGVLTVFIFPKVMPIFQSLDIKLPLSTIIILTISDFLSNYGWHVIIGAVIIFIASRFALHQSPPFRFAVHQLALKIPVFGVLLKYYFMTNFCRTLGLLLKSGVSLVDAIIITGNTLGNEVYKRECQKMSASVIAGEQISTYLATKPHIFPDFTAHLIAIGETTGSLIETLIYLSNMFEAEVSDMTKNLSNAVEPILMIFMGLIVGFVAVSVITPIYEVTQHLRP
jgi:type II secretory pathway component PulF